MTNRSKPGGTFVPHLLYADVEAAMAWLCRAFGFRERLRITDGDGRVGHAQLAYGEGGVMLGVGTPTPASFKMTVSVDDVDAHYAQAVAHGAAIVLPPESHPFGERQYTAQDVEGYRWTFSQTMADVDPADWGAVVAQIHRT